MVKAAKAVQLSDEQLADLYKKSKKAKHTWAQFVAACKKEAKDTTEQGLKLRLGRWLNKGLKIETFEGQAKPKAAAKKSIDEMAKLFGVDIDAAKVAELEKAKN